MPLKAVIFVVHEELEQATITCLVWAQESSYRIEGVVVDRWHDVQAMVDDGAVDVVIVAEPWHLPPDRVPRIEIVAEQRRRPPPRGTDGHDDGHGDDDEGPPTPPGRRRPKPIG